MGEQTMPIVRHSDIAAEPFKGGATYLTLVGDAQGTTPIRVGIQNSPPGYKTLTRDDRGIGGQWRGLAAR
jgi:hypothetical protein